MLALTDKYRVVRRQNEITDDVVDEEILAQILDEFQNAVKSKGASKALEDLFLLLRQGMNRQVVGIKRTPNQCGQCQSALLAEDRGADVKLCLFCNCWLHGEEYCVPAHMQRHVKGILCRGFRRRLALRVIEPKKEASQHSEPGPVPAAGAASSSDP